MPGQQGAMDKLFGVGFARPEDTGRRVCLSQPDRMSYSDTN